MEYNIMFLIEFELSPKGYLGGAQHKDSVPSETSEKMGVRTSTTGPSAAKHRSQGRPGQPAKG
jgi:hypothetical protein